LANAKSSYQITCEYEYETFFSSLLLTDKFTVAGQQVKDGSIVFHHYQQNLPALLYIKSKSVADEENEKVQLDEDIQLSITTKTQLIQKLEELQKFQKLGEKLFQLPKRDEDIFVKPKVDRQAIQNSILAPMELDSLTNIMVDMIKRERRKYTVVKRDRLSIKEKLNQLKTDLKLGSRTVMSKLINSEKIRSLEKDKLILRLLKKDLVLATRLYFELVDTETVEQKREKLAKIISKKIKHTNERFYSVGYLLMDIRYISGDINEHVRITKDKLGEITLNLQMLIEVLTINRMHILAAKPNNCIKFYTYIVARAFKILLLIKAIDEDYLIEFKEDLETLGNLFLSYEHLMKHAIYNGLDVNWLLEAEIPQNIVAIHKEIRANGFLK
jgi:hypothetical protein